MTNGATVAAFEREFAAYVGAKYAIAMCNGTATLHTALVALGVKPGDRVAVPPLTMSATTLAVLQAGAVPVFRDVDPDTWLMLYESRFGGARWTMPVSLYGMHVNWWNSGGVDDAAQTLRPHGRNAFTSYSFQQSKLLALGEGGMLVTDDEALALAARSFSSLGYRLEADQPRIDPATLKAATFARHHLPLAFNFRMNDATAAEGLRQLDLAAGLLALRGACAALYRDAIADCGWITPQYVPDGWTHDYWTFAVACDTPERAAWLQEAVVQRGGERPYAAWRLTYDEPAFAHLAPDRQCPACGNREGYCTSPRRCTDPTCGARWTTPCPVAGSLQPRLLQFQTNDLVSAETNARALRRAVIDGT